MNNVTSILVVAPNLEIPITFQEVPTKNIIGWVPCETTENSSVLVCPVPLLIDYDGIFELIQPQSTWSADIADANLSHLHAIVINGADNTKAINLLRYIHTNRTNQSRQEIVKQFVNDNVLKQHIIEGYGIKKPITHVNQLLGHEIYSSRQLCRFASAKKDKCDVTKQSTAIDKSCAVKNESKGIEKHQYQKEEPPLLTKAKVKKYRKQWNQFRSSKKGIKQFDQIISKFPTEQQSKVKSRVIKLMDEHPINLDQAWVKINQGLRKLDGEKS